MALKYPLHYYDDSGRMKPPLFAYLLLVFVCRGLMILIISLSFREDSERLLRIFYPLPYHFYLSLIPIIPALLSLFLISKRTILWKKARFAWFKPLRWCLGFALLLDIVIQLFMLREIYFVYSVSHGLSLLIAFSGIIYLINSSYIKHLVLDWTTP